MLIKVGLLFLLMIPASYNLRKVGPGLVKLRDKAGAALQALAAGFRRSIRWEALLVSVVVIFSALLTLSAPAADPSAYAVNAPTPIALVSPTAVTPLSTPTKQSAQATATSAPPSTLTLTQTVHGVDVTLTITHSIVEDELHVSLRGPKGPITACGPTPGPDDDCALSVKLTLTELSDNSSRTVDAPGDGNGGFTVPAGPYLPFDDTWQVVTTVRRYNQPEDVRAAYRYVLSGSTMTGKVSDYDNVDVATTLTSSFRPDATHFPSDRQQRATGQRCRDQRAGHNARPRPYHRGSTDGQLGRNLHRRPAYAYERRLDR